MKNMRNLSNLRIMLDAIGFLTNHLHFLLKLIQEDQGSINVLISILIYQQKRKTNILLKSKPKEQQHDTDDFKDKLVPKGKNNVTVAVFDDPQKSSKKVIVCENLQELANDLI